MSLPVEIWDIIFACVEKRNEHSWRFKNEFKQRLNFRLICYNSSRSLELWKLIFYEERRYKTNCPESLEEILYTVSPKIFLLDVSFSDNFWQNHVNLFTQQEWELINYNGRYNIEVCKNHKDKLCLDNIGRDRLNYFIKHPDIMKELANSIDWDRVNCLWDFYHVSFETFRDLLPIKHLLNIKVIPEDFLSENIAEFTPVSLLRKCASLSEDFLIKHLGKLGSGNVLKYHWLEHKRVFGSKIIKLLQEEISEYGWKTICRKGLITIEGAKTFGDKINWPLLAIGLFEKCREDELLEFVGGDKFRNILIGIKACYVRSYKRRIHCQKRYQRYVALITKFGRRPRLTPEEMKAKEALVKELKLCY